MEHKNKVIGISEFLHVKVLTKYSKETVQLCNWYYYERIVFIFPIK